MTDMNSKTANIVLILSIFYASAWLSIYIYRSPFWDEIVYLNLANHVLLNPFDPLPSSLANKIPHPPFLWYYLAITHGIPPRASLFIISILILILSYFILLKIPGVRKDLAPLSVSIILLNPVTLFYMYTIFNDALSALVVALSLLSFQVYSYTGGTRWLWYSYLSAALSSFIRYQGGLLSFLTIFTWLVMDGKLKRAGLTLVIGSLPFIVLSPFIYRQLSIYNTPTNIDPFGVPYDPFKQFQMAALVIYLLSYQVFYLYACKGIDKKWLTFTAYSILTAMLTPRFFARYLMPLIVYTGFHITISCKESITINKRSYILYITPMLFALFYTYVPQLTIFYIIKVILTAFSIISVTLLRGERIEELAGNMLFLIILYAFLSIDAMILFGTYKPHKPFIIDANF